MNLGKFTVVVGVWVALATSSRATDVPLGAAFSTQNYTIASFSGANTNSTGTGLFVEPNYAHTIQITLSTNLVSSATFAVDGSLDNTNWVVLTVTNSIANTGGTTLFTVSGKYSYLRVRNVIGTNAVGTATYLGGR